MNQGILILDLHGFNQYQAKVLIDSRLRSFKGYRIRLIHGYRNGSALQEMIRKTYRSHPKILRLELGLNPGETDLVLKEY